MNNPLPQIRLMLRPAFAVVGAAMSDDDGAAESRRRQKAQDDLGAAARRRDEEHSTTVRVGPGAAVMGAMTKEWFATRAGEGVTHKEDEIRISYDGRKGLSRAQVDRMIDVAMEKGWKQLYVYNSSGKPDIETAKKINEVIKARGLDTTLHCCTDAKKLCPHFNEMKRLARDPKAVAALAVTATAAAAVATAVVDHLQHS